MDEFAQSREDDDLFADEFEAVPEPTAAAESRITDHSISGASTTSEGASYRGGVGGGGRGAGGGNSIADSGQQHGAQNGRRGHAQGHQQGQERRGRGSGARGGQGGQTRAANAGLGASRYATQSSEAAPASPQTSAPPETTTIPITTPQEPLETPQPSIPTQISDPTAVTSTRIPAVRGDRSATGGPLHKKLTEEELTAKLEKMAILNAQKAERHRLSEADQAAFQHREKELAQERRQKAVAERKNERAMEMERAKNRERKMKAQGVREWDSEKQESDIVDGRGRGRSSEFVRGGYGGVIRGAGAGLGGSRYANDGDDIEGEQTHTPRGGRGGRERGGGRGGGGGAARGGKVLSPTVPTTEDFPSLPTPTKTATPAKATVSSTAPTKLSSSSTTTEAVATTTTTNTQSTQAQLEATPEASKVISPMAEKGPHDWAEEMATPIEEKKTEIAASAL